MNVQKPVRVTHKYRQTLHAVPSAVFPLLCPVREMAWVKGWDPKVVFSDSGHAEQDCVFITPEQEGEAVWTITEYDPDALRIGLVKVIPQLMVVRIRIKLHQDGSEGTIADVSYTFTALASRGERIVREMTEEAYKTFMRTWEDALNRHLSP